MQKPQAGVPERITPCQIPARLGSGCMGRVFLARSRGGRSPTIKVIRAELGEDADFRAGFGCEADVAKKVSGLVTTPVVNTLVLSGKSSAFWSTSAQTVVAHASFTSETSCTTTMAYLEHL